MSGLPKLLVTIIIFLRSIPFRANTWHETAWAKLKTAGVKLKAAFIRGLKYARRKIVQAGRFIKRWSRFVAKVIWLMTLTTLKVFGYGLLELLKFCRQGLLGVLLLTRWLLWGLLRGLGRFMKHHPGLVAKMTAAFIALWLGWVYLAVPVLDGLKPSKPPQAMPAAVQQPTPPPGGLSVKAFRQWQAKLPKDCPEDPETVVLKRDASKHIIATTTKAGQPTGFSRQLPQAWSAFPGKLNLLAVNEPWAIGLRQLSRETSFYSKAPVGASLGFIDAKGSLLLCPQSDHQTPKRVWDSVAVINTQGTPAPVQNILLPVYAPPSTKLPFQLLSPERIKPWGQRGPHLVPHSADRNDGDYKGAGQNQLALVFTWGPGQAGEILLVGFLPDGSLIWPCDLQQGTGWRYDEVGHQDQGVQCTMIKQ